MPTGADYTDKLERLDALLAALPGAVVAFSGGVDSAMLLHACTRALGDRVLAVTARSPSLPGSELADAVEFARELGVRHEVIDTDELAREGYRRNAGDRCYFCKTELFERMAEHLADMGESGYPVLYGAIADDLTDHRPGATAAAERAVLAPLAELAFGKEDVRRYSRAHGLATADKPSFACLSSRVAYGTAIDAELLGRLERGEAVLRGLGYRQFRLRHHGAIARIELAPDELWRAVVRDRDAIVGAVRAAGWSYVTLDLQGFRSGSMNEVME